MLSFLLAAILFAAFDNLDLGIPGPADQIIERRGYALGYSERYEQPLWVSTALPPMFLCIVYPHSQNANYDIIYKRRIWAYCTLIR